MPTAFDTVIHLYPLVALLLVVLGVMLWLTGARARAVAVLLVAVFPAIYAARFTPIWGYWPLTIRHALALVGEGAPPPSDLLRAGGPTLTVMSYNLYNGNRNEEAVLALLDREDVDVFAFMEAWVLWPFVDELRERFPVVSGCDGEYWECGILVLSRHAVADVDRSPRPGMSNRFVRVSMGPCWSDAVLAVAHMVKPHHDSEQYHQATAIAGTVRHMERPVILTGDFNAVPWSRTFRRLAFYGRLHPPEGYRATWPAALGPFGLPIDHVLTNDQAAIASVDIVQPDIGSNHRGLLATIHLPPVADDLDCEVRAGSVN